MGKITLLFIIAFSIIILPPHALAQENNHTAREEAEGKVVWEKLQNRQISCNQLSDSDFGKLGEYYMGQMTSSSHEAMNTMMTQMMGQAGEEQMHVVMGKRLSDCGGVGGGGNFMMGYWGGNWGVGSGLSWVGLVILTVIIVDLVLLGLWLWKQIQKK